MQDMEISPEEWEFQPKSRLVVSLVEIPIPRVRFSILHGLAHDGLFFSNF